MFYEFIFKKTIIALAHIEGEGDLGGHHVDAGEYEDDHDDRMRMTNSEHPVRQPDNSKYITPNVEY